MELRPATPLELEAVHSALANFRVHGVGDAVHPHSRSLYEGTIDDIDVLDFYDYEGLSYPSSGEAGAALVWGNVVATQMPFRWFFDDELGGLVLRSPDESLTIWPFGRIYESQRSSETQFGKFRWLLGCVVLQYLGHFDPEPEEASRLLQLLDGEGWGPEQFIDDTLKRLRVFRSRIA